MTEWDDWLIGDDPRSGINLAQRLTGRTTTDLLAYNPTTVLLNLRVDPALPPLLTQLAEQHGIDRSRYVRRILRDALITAGIDRDQAVTLTSHYDHSQRRKVPA